MAKRDKAAKPEKEIKPKKNQITNDLQPDEDVVGDSEITDAEPPADESQPENDADQAPETGPSEDAPPIPSKKDVTKFADNPGLPAREHEKKLAKEKSAKDLKNKVAAKEQYYTIKNGKILQITIKPNGAYSSYVDSLEKRGDQYKAEIKRWAAEGKFIPEHEYEEKVHQLVAAANARAQVKKVK